MDFVAAQRPGRQLRVRGDGGDATKEFRRDLPDTGPGVSRFRLAGKLDALPEPPTGNRRGRPPRQGPLLGSPNTWVRKRRGWPSHPTAAPAEGHSWVGLWHPVLPARLVHVVVVRRPPGARPTPPGQRMPRPPAEAFFTTDLGRSVADLLRQYRDRWAVDVTIRDRHTCDGLGQDQCRKLPHILGATTFRLVRAATRPLWCLDHVTQGPALALRRYRPWSRQKDAPSQLDIGWAGREALLAAGVFPIPRFTPDLAETHEEPEKALPSAA